MDNLRVLILVFGWVYIYWVIVFLLLINFIFMILKIDIYDNVYLILDLCLIDIKVYELILEINFIG